MSTTKSQHNNNYFLFSIFYHMVALSRLPLGVYVVLYNFFHFTYCFF